jgi:phytoene synthase
MADVVARATQPALAAIKLAWWREQLEALDRQPAPAEPRLQTAASELLPRGLPGAELAKLEQGWSALLHDPPDVETVAARGTTLFELGSRLLGAEFIDETVGVAGRLFAGVDVARRGLATCAAGLPGSGGAPIARQARPLTALGALAARDLRRGGPPFEPEATPGRAFKLLRHKLSGRL